MNYLQSSRVDTAGPTLPMAWLPAFFGLAVIGVESTALMGGANTGRWLLELCHSLWGQTDGPAFEMAHVILRKLGHFVGYGTLALFFRRGWYASVRRGWTGTWNGLRGTVAALAVASTLVVASLDEWHQSFLVGRGSSPHDVMLDTLGAILFNAVLLVVVARRRRALLV
jgi:VanZ family protein